jgi:hypothetical protein
MFIWNTCDTRIIYVTAFLRILKYAQAIIQVWYDLKYAQFGKVSLKKDQLNLCAFSRHTMSILEYMRHSNNICHCILYILKYAQAIIQVGYDLKYAQSGTRYPYKRIS